MSNRLPTGLNVADIVNVSVNLAPLAAQFRNFGALAILGPSNVIDTNERMRVYTNLNGVAADFMPTSPEYLAAVLFFSQNPQPAILYIARWAQVATFGLLHGGVLTPTQQLLSNFTPISNGAFLVYLDGIPYSLQGIGLTGALNINGVASTIQTSLQAVAAGTTFIWGSVHQRFDLMSGTVGAKSSVSPLSPPTASGWFNFAANPLNNATITVAGTVVTFVTATPVGLQVQIGVDLPTTLQNLLTFLNASADTNIVKMTYTLGNTVGSKIYCVAKITGAGGNAYTLAGSVATVSGATLAGGSGTDLSGLLNGTVTLASSPVLGSAAEEPVAAIADLDNISGLWYGAMFAAVTPPTDAQYIAVSAYIEGASRSHIFGVNVNATTVLDPVNNTDLASALNTLAYSRTMTQYSSSSSYAIASIFGRVFTVNYNANNSVLTAKFKIEPGVVAEFITESQAAALKTKCCNVFVNYQNGKAIIQEGVMSNGFFIDDRINADWLQNELQNNCFNLLYQSPTKIPQTDPGIHQLVNQCNDTLDEAVFNGMVAPGKWTVAGFGQLNMNDYLTTGYYVFVIPLAQQSQVDREARKAPPIQIAIKMAGAVHAVFVIVTVNR